MRHSSPNDPAAASCSLPFDEAIWRRVSDRLSLSEQQLRIVELILRDEPDKRIAEELGISFSTLRTHLGRIHARLNSRSRTGLILLVCRLSHAD